MGTKRVARKKTKRSNTSAQQTAASRSTKRARNQEDIEEEVPTKYSDEAWSKARMERLESMPFGTNEYLDWRLLQAYGLERQIRDLISIGPWDKFFEINEPAYREITLEFLSTLKLDRHDMTFQAYGRKHHVYPYAFGQYLGLYTYPECVADEFRALTNSWPVDMTAQRCWEQFCGEQIKYNPSNSKATLMKDVNLRVAHHFLAHTIGGRKSSHGVVNNSELFQLYSMATRQPINVGLEVARYLYRQASDPRSRGIYCGGYVTKFLKGFRIFKEPQGDPGLHCSKITDRPFPSWNLVKLIDQATPPRELSAPITPASSRVPPESDLQKLMKEFKEEREQNKKERERNKKERQKNKRFRASVWKFLGRLATCFTPPPADLPTYESSPEPTSSTSESTRKKGKQPAESVSTEDEPDDEEEEETEANASNHESDEEDNDEDSDDAATD